LVFIDLYINYLLRKSCCTSNLGKCARIAQLGCIP
jgi:hypothetical protein